MLSDRKRTDRAPMNTAKKRICYFITAALVVLLDQVSKFTISAGFSHEGESITVIPGVLDFTFVLNEGATAGMLADRRWVFMTVSVVAIIAIALYLFFSKNIGSLVGIALSAVAGGGIGNMIDRTVSGAVVDFVDVTCIDIFPFNTVFNVADIFVCVGCAVFIFAIIREEVADAKAKKATENAAKCDGTDGCDGGDCHES